MKAINRSAQHPFIISPDAFQPSAVDLGNPKSHVGFTQAPQATLGRTQSPSAKSATRAAPELNAQSIYNMAAHQTLPITLTRGLGGKKCFFGSHKMSDVLSCISGYIYSHPTPKSQSAGRMAQVLSGLLARNFGAERVPLSADLVALSRARFAPPKLCYCPDLDVIVGFCFRKPAQNVLSALASHPAAHKLLVVSGELYDPAFDRNADRLGLGALDYLLSCDALGRVSGMTGEQASTRADAYIDLDDAALACALSVVSKAWELGAPLNWRIDTPRERHFYVALSRALSWHPSVIERCWVQLKARGLVVSARHGNWGARGLCVA